MADWTGSRIGRFFGRYVDWETFEEGDEYPFITGGSVELSAFSSTKVSGTVKFDGEAPDPSKLLRIYYEFEDAAGDRETRAVCTMLLEVSSDDRDETLSSGSARMDSVLKVLQDRHYGGPYVVAAGTNAVERAAELCAELGLNTNGPASDYVLSKQKVFPAEEASYLSIVNGLLSAAGYESASPDAYGNVLMQPYVEPTDREPAYTFKPGSDSVMGPIITVTSDWHSSPNAVRLSYESETELLTAYALNIDPVSKASLPNRGWREKTLFESVTEIEGTNVTRRLASLISAARRKLIDNSAEVEKAEISCPYLPIEQGDSVAARYAGIDWKASVSNYLIDLGDDSSSKLTARKYVKRNLDINAGGGIVWMV